MVPWLVFGFNMSYGIAETMGYLSMILALSVIFLALRYYRNKLNDGKLKFWQGMQLGVGITLIPALLSFIWTVVFFIFWGDDFKEFAADHFREKLDPQSFAVYEANLNNPLYTNAFFQGFVLFLTVLVIGIIISLISSLILKRDGGRSSVGGLQ